MMLSITATAIGITTLAVGSLSAAIMHGANERQIAAAIFLVRTAYWLHAISLVLAGILTWMLVSRMIGPIRGLARVVEELRVAKARADGANEAKGQFLAHMSHEIRTPMTSILGFAEMMLEPDQTPAQRQDALLAICRNARHLSDLINDVLDLSKIDAAQMTVERILCDLPDLIAQAICLTKPDVVKKGLDFKVELDGPVPRQILTDPLRVRQILVNLIANARRFTDEGAITLRVGCCPQADDCEKRAIRFSVVDTGIGMTREQLANLFRPFSQAEASTSRRFGGTGLGLAICKSLANLLGGDITAESLPGGGSTFTVQIDGGRLDNIELVDRLPEAAPKGSAASESGPAVTLQGRILLAEDGPDTQKLISLYLRRAGAEVAIAENGREALERLAAEHFDLVLMDLQMPEVNGCTATTILRQNGCTMPIIALTAQAMSGDREKCRQAGFDDYLTKPIDKARLLKTVRRYLPEQSIAGDASADRLMTSELSDDPDLAELLPGFVRMLPKKVDRLFELLSAGELHELCQLAHQLKGAAGGYGFPLVTQGAAQLESELHESAPLDQITATVAELAFLIRRVEGYPGDMDSEPIARTAAGIR
jgi:signal transduction histidine kinase/DNA-binding response OmpR family regulator